jgi:uncharacterized protein with ATP-grasp and redox domains
VIEVLRYLQTLSFENPRPVISKKMHAIVCKITKCTDPYKKVKDQSNIMAEKLYPQLKDMDAKVGDLIFRVKK